MLAALAADAPEITAAVTAVAGHHARIGAGVVIGSNVFNIAALLGLSAVLAGRISLHRRVVLLEGAVAVAVAVVCLVVVTRAIPAAAGLGLVLIVLVPYLLVLGVSRERLARVGLPPTLLQWLELAVTEEELELEVAIHPTRGRAQDARVAVALTLVVVGASVAMEQSASTLGARNSVAEIVVGALVLAAVTSLPNAVAAVYLARRGRGAATLSTAMNSNALNVAAGLLVPATIAGLGAPSSSATLVAAWYLGMTVLALGCAYSGRGMLRAEGLLIIGAYVVFVVLILTRAYASTAGMVLAITLPVVVGGTLARTLSHRDARTRPVVTPGSPPP